MYTIMRILILLGLTIPPILIPLNLIGGRNKSGGVNGLDRLSFVNISLSKTDRYWVYLALLIAAVISLCYIL